MRYNYVKILIITILFSLCYAEENIIFQIDERGYWTGIKKYTVYKDGKCEVKSQMEHGKGSDFVKSGSIDAYRVDNYMKLFRAVGYFDVTNESLGIDRAAGKGAIRVSDGLSVAIKIWDGRNFHEVSEG